MKQIFIFLVSFLLSYGVAAESLATLPEHLTIKPYKSDRAWVVNSDSDNLLGHLSLSDSTDKVNYVYTDTNDQQKITFKIEQHFGEMDAFLFQIFDENQTLIGKLAINNTSNWFFKGFALYSPDETMERIVSGKADPVIVEPGEMFSKTFNIYNKEKQILATVSGRAGRVEVKFNKDVLANESFIINNPTNLDLLLAIFAMQSLESIQKRV